MVSFVYDRRRKINTGKFTIDYSMISKLSDFKEDDMVSFSDINSKTFVGWLYVSECRNMYNNMIQHAKNTKYIIIDENNLRDKDSLLCHA